MILRNYTKVSGLSYTLEGDFNTADVGVFETVDITVTDVADQEVSGSVVVLRWFDYGHGGSQFEHLLMIRICSFG